MAPQSSLNKVLFLPSQMISQGWLKLPLPWDVAGTLDDCFLSFFLFYRISCNLTSGFGLQDWSGTMRKLIVAQCEVCTSVCFFLPVVFLAIFPNICYHGKWNWLGREAMALRAPDLLRPIYGRGNLMASWLSGWVSKVPNPVHPHVALGTWLHLPGSLFFTQSKGNYLISLQCLFSGSHGIM